MIRHDPNMIKHNKLPGLAMTITKFPWWLLNKNINLIHGNLSLVRYKENQRINKSHKLLTKVGGKKKDQNIRKQILDNHGDQIQHKKLQLIVN